MIDLNTPSCVHVIRNKSETNSETWNRSMFRPCLVKFVIYCRHNFLCIHYWQQLREGVDEEDSWEKPLIWWGKSVHFQNTYSIETVCNSQVLWQLPFCCPIMTCTLRVWVPAWQTSTALQWETSLTQEYTPPWLWARWLLSLVPDGQRVNLPPALLYGFWQMLIDVTSL